MDPARGARETRDVAKRRQAARRARGFWAKVVAEFESSSLKQHDFCRRRGVELGTFRHWLYRLRHEGKKARPEKARFVPLVSAATASATSCRLRVGQVELAFGSLPPAGYVAEVIRLMDR